MTKIRTETYSVTVERNLQTNRILREQWQGDDGRLHRLGDEPADIEYSIKSGQAVRQEWRVDGYPHRDGDKPAIILTDPDSGNVHEIHYFRMGLEHRDTGPSSVKYNPQNGLVTRREWKREGMFAGGEDQPSVIEYDEFSGYPKRLIFGTFDTIHRRTGPAIIDLDPQSGAILAEHYYLSGERLETRRKNPTPHP